MRISDWSSDVCSSDLRARQGVARAAGMAAQEAFGLGLDRRPAVLGEGDDRAGLERVLRGRRTRPVAGLAGGGLGVGGEGDLHAQRMRGVGENLAFLAVAGGADLLTDGLGVGRLR